MDNDLDIVLRVRAADDAEAVIVRTLASVQAAVAAQGRKLGETFAKSFISSARDVFAKEPVTPTATNLRQKGSASGAEFATSFTKSAKVTFSRENLMDGVLAQNQKAMRQMVGEQERAFKEMTRQQDVFARAGVKSPDAVKRQLDDLRQTKAVWEQAGKGAEGYAGAMAKINSQINILEAGNARARGSLHKFTAALASATFEITGAVYGLTALAAVAGGPALFGVSYLKSIEDAKQGLIGTLINMSKFPAGADKFSAAMGLANDAIVKVTENSLKFGIPLEEIVGVMRAITATGLQTGMTLEQIGNAATVGTLAVRALGLQSNQAVQELRDLFMGGIQPASSTLATSLGLRDSDIKKAKADHEAGIRDFYEFIMSKLEGYQLMAANRAQTLTGAYDILKVKTQMLFADESLFQGIKDAMNSVSNAIGKFNEETNKMEFNENIRDGVRAYTNDIGNLITFLGKAAAFTLEYGSQISGLIKWFVAAKAATFALSLAGVDLSNIFAKKQVQLAATTSATVAATAATTGLTTAYAAVGAAGAASAVQQVTAMDKAKGAAIGLMSNINNIAGAAGVVGILLWGITSLLDQFSIFDSFLGKVEARAKEARANIRGMGEKDAQSALEQARRNITKLEELSPEVADVTGFTTRYSKKVGLSERGEVFTEQEMNRMSPLEREALVIRRSVDVLNVELARAEAAKQRIADIAKSSEVDIHAVPAMNAMRKRISENIKDTELGKIEEAREALKMAKKDYEQSIAILARDQELYLKASGTDKEDLAASIRAHEEFVKKAEIVVRKREEDLANVGKAKSDIAATRKSYVDGYRQLEEELRGQVANGTKSFIAAWKERDAYLQTLLANQPKHASKTRKEMAKNDADMIVGLVKLGKEAADANAEFAKSLMPESQSIQAAYDASWGKITTAARGALDDLKAEYENASGERRTILEGMITEAQKAFDALDKLKLGTGLRVELAKINEAFNDTLQAIQMFRAKTELDIAKAGGGVFAQRAAEPQLLTAANQEYLAAQQRVLNIERQIAAAKDLDANAQANLNRQLNEAKIAAMNAEKGYYDLANQQNRTFGKGAQRALENYEKSLRDLAQQTEQIMGSALKSVEDMIVSAFSGGAVDAKSIMKKLLQDIQRMFIQQTIMVPITAVLRDVMGLGGTGAGGAAGQSGSGSNFFAMASDAYKTYNTFNQLGSDMSAGWDKLVSVFGGITTSSAVGTGASLGFSNLFTNGATAGGAAGGSIITSSGATAGGATSSMGTYAAYAGSVLRALQGDIKGAATQAALTYAGSVFGPVGAAIGSFIGSFIGGGGGEKYPTMLGDASGTWSGNKYTKDTVNVNWGKYAGSASMGVDNQLDAVVESFSTKFKKMFEAFGIEDDVTVSARTRLRRTSGKVIASLWVDFGEGLEKVAGRQYGGDAAIEKSIQKFLEDVTTKGVKKAVEISKLPQMVKDLFAPLEKPEEIEKAFDSLLIAQEILKSLGTTITEFVGEDLEKYRIGNENLVQTLERTLVSLGAVNGAFEKLGLATYDIDLKSGDAASALVVFSGGIEAFAQKTQYYYENFYSESERTLRMSQDLAKSFAAINVAMPENKEQFRSLVENLDLTTESGQEAFATLMNLAPSFVALTDGMMEQLDTLMESVQDSLDDLTLSNVEKQIRSISKAYDEQKASAIALGASLSDLAKIEQLRVAKLDVVVKDAQAAYDSAVENLNRAYESEKGRLETIDNSFKDIIDRLRKFKDSLILSNLSTLSPEQKYLESKRQFEGVAALAKTGDQKAMAELEGASNTFLEASREYYASAEAYAQDFNLVLATLDSTEAIAQHEAMLAQVQLDELKKMVIGVAGLRQETASGMAAIQAALQSVAVAQAQLAAAISAQAGAQQAAAQQAAAQQAAAQQAAAQQAAAQQAAAQQAAAQQAAAQQAAAQQAAAQQAAAQQAAVQQAAARAALEAVKGISAKDISSIAGGGGNANIYAIGSAIQSATPSDIKTSKVTQLQLEAAIQSATGVNVAALGKSDLVNLAESLGISQSTVASLPKRANGGLASGWTIVGERGPELANFKNPAMIYTAEQTRSVLSGERVLTAQQTTAMDTYAALMQRLMSKSDAPAQKTENTAPILQAGFNGVIQKLDAVEKRLERIEDDQRKAELDK